MRNFKFMHTFNLSTRLKFALIYLYAKYRINNNEYNPTNTNG